nr:hypothetical protein FFPRI1PSEUD_41240 [Pseudomonas sp. FFPRI_1]
MNDAALQPERTALAWRRTQVLLLLVAALALRCWPRHPSLVAAVSALAVFLALAILLEQGRCYRRACRGIAAQGPTCNPLPILFLSLGASLLAALALFAVLLDCPGVSLR